jgi:GNAT superfamily N-acetyltransferase
MTAHQVFSRAGNAIRRVAPASLACPAGELVVRRLGRADLPAIEAHFLALGPGDRTSRFHALLGDDAVRHYVHRIDFRRMILVGAFDLDSDRLIGLAEAHLDAPAAPLRAEASVSVLASRRGRGIGRLLMAVALDAAAARGTRRANFYYQTGNRPIAHLVRDLGRPVETAPGFAALALPLGPSVQH